MKGRRLVLTVSCPNCSHPVKPVVVSSKRGKPLMLACPMPDCQKEFEYRPGMEVR